MSRQYDLPVSVETARDTLREKFRSNAHIKDTRVIDMLVIKGQQDLQEVVEIWAQSPHIMSKHFKEAIKERPKDFMSKFLSGHDWDIYSYSNVGLCRWTIFCDYEMIF